MNQTILYRRQQGFTLVELIVVIVILGILAATALPKFADFGTDARTASVKGAVGALNTAATFTKARYLIAPLAPIVIEGTTVTVSLASPSYPRAGANLGLIAGLKPADYVQVLPNATATANLPGTSPIQIAFVPISVSTNPKGLNCYAMYTEPTVAAGAPVIAAVTSSC